MRSRWVAMGLWSWLLVAVCACGGGSAPPEDAGGGVDAGSDAAVTPPDAAPDGAPVDAGEDASTDAAGGRDASPPMVCVPPGECDPFVADGCPEGEVCVTRDSGRTQCRPATGSAGLGEPCARAEDCQSGLLCVNVAGVTTCHRACPEGSVGACEGEDRCIGSIGDRCVRYCRPRPRPCDIYRQDCPDPTDACTFAVDPETGENYTGCRPAGPGGHGESCGSEEGFCAAGYVCIRREGAATCHEVCDATAPEDTCSVDGEVCEGVSSTWRVTYCRPPIP